MALRQPFRPLRPDLDGFLFAAVGPEQDGIPLSVISALARLGLDPWEEAGRLSSLDKREAVEQLGRLIAELPGSGRSLPEAREIAGGLVEHLPKRDGGPPRPTPIRWRRRLPRWPRAPKQSQLLIFCLVVAAAALVSIVLHHGLPFGIALP